MSRPDKRSPARVGTVVVVLALGALGYLWCGRPPAPTEILTPTRFSSTNAPALSIEMPTGWTLIYDRQAGRITATGGNAMLILETSNVTDGIDTPQFRTHLSEQVGAAGGKLGEPFTQTFDGLTGTGFPMAVGDRSSTLWYVPRGGSLLTVITCRAEAPADSRVSCAGPLQNLKWRSP